MRFRPNLGSEMVRFVGSGSLELGVGGWRDKVCARHEVER